MVGEGVDEGVNEGVGDGEGEGVGQVVGEEVGEGVADGVGDGVGQRVGEEVGEIRCEKRKVHKCKCPAVAGGPNTIYLIRLQMESEHNKGIIISLLTHSREKMS